MSHRYEIPNGGGGEGMGGAIPTIERTPYMYLDLGYFITLTIHNTIMYLFIEGTVQNLFI